MPIEFTVTLRNTPGALAEIGAALGEKGVNIHALQAMSFGDQSVLKLVVSNPALAGHELEDHGLPFRTREVLAVRVSDEPGRLGQLSEAIAAQGVNIDSAYLAMDQSVILGVSNMERAAAVARSLGSAAPESGSPA